MIAFEGKLFRFPVNGEALSFGGILFGLIRGSRYNHPLDLRVGSMER